MTVIFQVLIRCWQPVTGAPCLWAVRHSPWSIWFPLLCFLLHFICWAIICSIIIIFDYPELMGIKQVRILSFIPYFRLSNRLKWITNNKYLIKSHYKSFIINTFVQFVSLVDHRIKLCLIVPNVVNFMYIKLVA